jgi:polysaccharide pyruvyl transferase WcaK-like protein
MLKTQLLHIWQNIQATIRRWMRNSKTSQAEKTALFVPPANTEGSLGDEAMFAASIDYLLKRGFSKIGLVSFDPTANWNIEPVHQIVSTYSLKDRLRLVDTISQYSHLYCLGADVMDGFYSDRATLERLRIVELAARAGVESTILGFSFNDRPTPAAVKAFANLPANVRICCRDSVSQSRLIKQIQRPVELVADLAFLLKPTEQSPVVSQVTQWIQAQRSSGRKVVGFNAKKLYPSEGTKVEFADLIQVYVDALTTVFERDPQISLLLIPHDTRPAANDVALAEAIFKGLPPAIQAHCMQVPMPCRAAEVKAFCAELDVVITGRMHLAIACLGQATPVGSITYQGKFEGLFQHFGLHDVTISPEQAFQSGELANFCTTIIAQRQSLREQLQTTLPQVKLLAAANFAGQVVPKLVLVKQPETVGSAQ